MAYHNPPSVPDTTHITARLAALTTTSTTVPLAALITTPTNQDVPITAANQDTMLTTQNILPAPAKEGEKTFEFFTLPRELRDEIYDNMVFRKRVIEREPAIEDPVTWTFESSINDLRLIPRQFRQEYQQRIKRHAVLAIKGPRIENICYGLDRLRHNTYEDYVVDTVTGETFADYGLNEISRKTFRKATRRLEVEFGVTRWSLEGPVLHSERLLWDLVQNIRIVYNWKKAPRFKRCRSWAITARVAKSTFERYIADHRSTAIGLFADAAKSFQQFEKLTEVEVLAEVEEDADEVSSENEEDASDVSSENEEDASDVSSEDEVSEAGDLQQPPTEVMAWWSWKKGWEVLQGYSLRLVPRIAGSSSRTLAKRL